MGIRILLNTPAATRTQSHCSCRKWWNDTFIWFLLGKTYGNENSIERWALVTHALRSIETRANSQRTQNETSNTKLKMKENTRRISFFTFPLLHPFRHESARSTKMPGTLRALFPRRFLLFSFFGLFTFLPQNPRNASVCVPTSVQTLHGIRWPRLTPVRCVYCVPTFMHGYGWNRTINVARVCANEIRKQQ